MSYFKLDLSNNATKSDLKKTTRVDTSDFTEKADLNKLKSDVDKLHIEKINPVPDDLYNLSNVVKEKVVEKTVYHKLVKKVNAIQTIDTSNLV